MMYLIAMLAGAASVLAYAPFELFWLLPLSWGVLYALLRRDTLRPAQAAGLGWAWGTGAWFAGLCWLVVALHRFGGLSGPLSVGLIAFFCAALAAYPALAAWGFVRLRSRGWAFRALLMAACWLAVELLRGQVFPAFPWLVVGYTQTPPSPLAGWGPVLGVYGVSFVLVLGSACAVEALLNPRARRGAAALLALLLLGGAGLRQVVWTQPVGEPVRVALIQPNVAQDEKWRPELAMSLLQQNLAALRQYPAQIMVLPEGSLPMLEGQLPQGYLEQVAQQARALGGDALLGFFTQDAQGRIYNSLQSYGQSPTQRYSKNHLVPFGEFQPWGFGWFFKLARIPMSDQAPGGDHQAPLLLAGHKVAVNICYEDVFGEELRRALPEAGLMLNVSNLAWYGDSHAQPQHLQMSRMRALESGRPQLRATNTGMTGVVNPDGSLGHILPPFTQGAVLATVRSYQGLTPFIVLGDWPIKALCLAVLLAAAYLRRRR